MASAASKYQHVAHVAWRHRKHKQQTSSILSAENGARGKTAASAAPGARSSMALYAAQYQQNRSAALMSLSYSVALALIAHGGARNRNARSNNSK